MKKIVIDNRLLIKCCKMYYIECLTQSEIASQLGISRTKVSRLLKEAREKEIVKIEIKRSEHEDYDYLEECIERKYNLKEVIIVNDCDNELINLELANAAAKYLERIVKKDDIVGVSMGTTIKEIASFVNSNNSIDTMFVPLIGGVGQTGNEIHPNQIVMELSRVFKGKFKLLHAPAIISNLELKKNLMEEKSISDVLEYINKVNIAIVGIGAPTEKSTMMSTGYFDNKQLVEMKKNKVVGDICLQFYDTNGNHEQYTQNSMVFGMNLENLRKIDRVIGVAEGDEKVEAIVGAINGKYIDVLITNYSCAKKIFEHK